MRPIPLSIRGKINADPYYKKCARQGGDCEGRITMEHAFIYAGKQINELWAIIPLCVFHHLGRGLDKEENQRIALARATPEDLDKYSRKDWEQLQKYLEDKKKL